MNKPTQKIFLKGKKADETKKPKLIDLIPEELLNKDIDGAFIVIKLQGSDSVLLSSLLQDTSLNIIPMGIQSLLEELPKEVVEQLEPMLISIVLDFIRKNEQQRDTNKKPDGTA